LIFGWMPAIGFYATGRMLDQLLIFGGKFWGLPRPLLN
jgi:hypothetical protein